MNIVAKPTPKDVEEGIFNLEEPLQNLRGLAYAIRALAASADQMPKTQLSAISAVADMMMMELDSMIDEHGSLWGLSIELTRQ